MDTALLEQLITTYLELNSAPSDEQVHSLAYSLGMSKEDLEEVMYQMMASHSNAALIRAEILLDTNKASVSEFTEVLEDNYDPDLTNLTDLASNDGDVDSDSDEAIQEVLTDDGIGPEDTGLGINVDESLNDGAVVISSVLTESLLGSLDPVKDSLMHSLLVLQKAKPTIVRYDAGLTKQVMNTVQAVKEALTEVKDLMDQIEG